MNAQDPELLIEIRIGSSGDLLQSYDRRELDTVIAPARRPRRRHGAGRGTAGWFAAPHWQHRADEPLPLATLAEPCGVCALAAKRLDESAVPWREVRRRRRGGGRGGRHGRAGRGRAGAPACCRSAPSTSALGCDCPRCARLPVLLHHARQGRPPPAGARRAVGGVPGRDTRLIRLHPGRAPYPFAAAVLAPARFTLTVSSQHTTKVHP